MSWYEILIDFPSEYSKIVSISTHEAEKEIIFPFKIDIIDD
jgi:hypothetical protein